MGFFTGTVFIFASDDPSLVQQVVDGVRPMVSRSGGSCLVSDALWVRH